LNSLPTPDTDRLSQHRPFIYFWFTRVTTIIGYQMLTVAVGWPGYGLTGGGFGLGSTEGRRFIPGFFQYLNGKSGNAVVKGAVLVFVANGKTSLVLPAPRLLWPVEKTKRLQLGVGAALNLTQGKPGRLLLGPVAQFTTPILGKSTRIMLRGGQWLSGPAAGERQVRLDVTSFF